ncbi:MAG: hypothetical protein IPM32_15450 [Ignavibacteriae bacterium]|nr:hypothetical protein [Ignavibacteriota bacterium]
MERIKKIVFFIQATLVFIMFQNVINGSGYIYSFTVENIHQINSHNLEFEIFLESKNGLLLNAYQCFLILNYDVNIFDQINLEVISNSSQLQNPIYKTHNFKRFNDCIIGFSSNVGSETIINKVRVGRFRFYSSKKFLFSELKLEWSFDNIYETIVLGADYVNVTNKLNHKIYSNNFYTSNNVALFNLYPGWNAISIPFEISKQEYENLKLEIDNGPFETINNQTHLVLDDTLKKGNCYWVFVENKKIVELYGKPLSKFDVEINSSGYYWIGSLPTTIDKNNIKSYPQNILQGNIFYWDNKTKEYVLTNNLIPYHAHIININQKGKIEVGS